MDSFEISKFAGAALCAALAIVLPRTLAEMGAEGGGNGEHASQAGYQLAMPGGAGKAGKGAAEAVAAPGATGGAAAGSSAEAAFDAVKPLLAGAKPDGGAATFKICAACHSGDKGGANKVGPGLWGVVGRKTGGVDGFSYSDGMKTKGGEWTYDRLAGFLSNPKGYVAGTKMSFNGVQDPAKLADLLAYLGTLSDQPVPLPK